MYHFEPLFSETTCTTRYTVEKTVFALSMKARYMYIMAFLSAVLTQVTEKPAKDATAMDTLVRLVKSFLSSDTGIVYCLTRKETEQVAQHLRQANVRAACYHAYMEDKEETHMAWFHNKLQVVVATIAFGLGINKPDVRFVIHFTLSKV